MRFKGRFTNGLLVALVLTLIPITAFSAQKITPGSTCKVYKQKVTYQSKVFTCIKSGKKLVWNKGLAKPTPQPTPTPENVLMSPWSTNTNGNQVTFTAKQNFSSWLQTGTNNSQPILLTIQPGIDKSDIQYIIDGLNSSATAFSKYVRQVPQAYFGTDDSWIISQLKKDHPEHSAFPNKYVCYEANPTAGCSWPNYGFIFFTATSSSNWNKYRDAALSGVGPHEYFHLVQESLFQKGVNDDPVKTWGAVPSWFIEGGANFVSAAITDHAGLADWTQARQRYILLYKDGRGTNEPLSSFQKNELDRPQPEGQSHSPYGIGMLACEYIVASAGMDGFLDIYKQVGAGKTFADAFISATGISLEKFYATFDSIRPQIGFYPTK